ncbi:hypothetical protein Tco_1396948, partial [Tanacetum coccineum]
YDDDEDYTIAITPDLPTKEPEYSLSMRDEHLSTIPEKESDEIIKFSVENLVLIPRNSKDFSDNESECDMPVCDDFTIFSNPLFDSDNDFTSSDDESLFDEDVPKENFKIYSNPLFDEEIISSKIKPHHFNVESGLIESLLNQDILTVSFPKIDSLLEEFSGELAHIDLIPPGIVGTDFDPKEEILLIEELLYDNSSPRPPEESNSEISNATIESFSPSSIPVEDSDPFMEEIDIFLALDESIPPSIDSDYSDSEWDNLFLERLLKMIPFPFPKMNTGVVTNKVVKGISEHYVLMPNILPTLPTFDPDLDFTPSYDSLGSGNTIFDSGIFIVVKSERLFSRGEFSISFISDHLSPLFDTMLLFSSENEDKVFNPGFLKIMKIRACFQSSNLSVFDLLLIMESLIMIMEDRTGFKEIMLGVLLLQEIRELRTELPKRPQNSDYFKEKILLVQAQENGVDLDEERLLFLAGGQTNTFDDNVDEGPVQDMAQNKDNIFQADQCDAFDSDVDEAPTTQTLFMANLFSAKPVYDEAGPSYDSDILSEIQDHDKSLNNMN